MKLLKIIFPKRRGSSLSQIFKTRLEQTYDLIHNILCEILDNKLKKKYKFNSQLRKNILIIIHGKRLSGSSNCPTTLRLINLKENKNFNWIFINEPISRHSKNSSIFIISRSGLLLLEILKNFSVINGFTSFWKIIFKRYKPDLIISIMPSLPMVKASKSLNIKIADIQHGMIHLDHDWYLDRFQNSNSTFYSYAPDILFVWSHVENKIINLMMERSLKKINNLKEIKIIGPNIYKIKRKKEFRHDIKKYLLTCSYGHKSFYSKDELKELDKYFIATKEFTTWALKQKNVEFRIRLHPAASNTYLHNIQIRGIENLSKKNRYSKFVLSSNNSLSEDLDWCDLHITLNSSCVIDAYFLSICSIILCPAYDKRINYQIFKNYGEFSKFNFPRNSFNSFNNLVDSCKKFQLDINKNQTILKDSKDLLCKQIQEEL